MRPVPSEPPLPAVAVVVFIPANAAAQLLDVLMELADAENWELIETSGSTPEAWAEAWVNAIWDSWPLERAD